MWETQVRFLGQGDPLEKEMATHSCILGKCHKQRSLVGYSPWGRKESDTTERLHFTSLHRVWGSLVGLWGRTESDTTEAT